MTNQTLLKTIDETLAWASDVSDKWTGTLHEKLIDSEQARLIKAVAVNDLERANVLVLSLAQMLDNADKAYERADNEY